MNTSVLVHGKEITLQLKQYAIRIFNNEALSAMLEQNAETATEELITCVKEEYFKLFNSDFKVSNASMAIEIWAHVYAEKFAEAVKDFYFINFIDKIAEKILHHAEIIDIGEQGHDENRFVWNSLAGFKSVIAGLLFTQEK
jgi:hypothetical protein